MTILVPKITLDGISEKIFKDNVDSPEVNLAEKVIAKVVADYKPHTLQRAMAEYKRQYQDGSLAGIQDVLSADIMIDWYLNLPGYKDETGRQIDIRTARIEADNAKIQKEIDAITEKIGNYQKADADYTDLIRDLTAEVATLQASLTK